MVIKSDFFKSSRFLFLKNENEFEIFRIPPPLFENIVSIVLWVYNYKVYIKNILIIYIHH